MNQFQFTTRVVAVESDATGVWHELETTSFYAEGGGQPADRGTIAAQAVRDVQVRENRVWHLLDEAIPLQTEVAAIIDHETRQDHSIQHTAQHVVTALLEDRYGIRTLSFGIGERDAAIELETATLEWSMIETIEQEMQQLIFENRLVKTYECDDTAVDHDRLRKATERKGSIRIVEIEGLDYNACGGTHVERTGQLGLFYVTAMKKVRGNVRLSFAAGTRALHFIQRSRHALRTIHQAFSTTDETVADRVMEERALRLAKEKEVNELEFSVAQARAEAALDQEGYVVTHFGHTESEALTTRILEHIAAAGRIAIGANHVVNKVILVHDGTQNVAVGALVKQVLAELGFGRGGGSHKQAQARFETTVELERATSELIRRLQEGAIQS